MTAAGLDRLTARAEATAAPLSATFELTGRCNLDCGHCYLDIAHPPPELSTVEALAVVDQLADAGTLFLTITGGEIFLRKDLLQIARHARRRGLALRLFTNATRITRALAAEVAALRPLAVEVSLYGTHAAAHDGVTQRPRSLRRTLRGIVLLRRAGVNVALKAPLLGVVADEVEALTRLARRLGTPLKLDPFVKPRLDGNQAPLALRADTAALAAALAHPAVGLPQALPPPPSPDEAPCVVGRRTVKIAATGEVFPCGQWPTAIGNLRNTPFSELWAGGPLLDRLRSITWKSMEGGCQGCGQQGYCARCLAVALVEDGALLAPSKESCRIAEAREIAAGVRVVSAGVVRLRVVA